MSEPALTEGDVSEIVSIRRLKRQWLPLAGVGWQRKIMAQAAAVAAASVNPVNWLG